MLSDWVSVDSSCTSEFVFHDDGSGVGDLDIRYRKSGKVYRYHGVEKVTYNALLTAPSRGVYINTVIKPNYSVRPL